MKESEPLKDCVRTLNFEALVNAYSKDLYRFGVWLTKDPHIAEDLTQETFLRAWKAMDKLKNPKAVKSWLFTIYRRENARRFEKVRPITVSTSEVNIDDFTYVENNNVMVDEYEMREGLKKLPIEYLEPLLLQVIVGCSCNEISLIMDIKPGAVMVRIYRARKKLQVILESDDISFQSAA